jgi:hypothetical protein
MEPTMNETTRMFPRSMDDAFPNTVEHNAMLERSIWFEPHQPKEIGYQFWYYVALSFFAGYFFFKIWG